MIVATVRALKYNGGVKKEDLSQKNIEALEKGIVNLCKHIENIKKFGVPLIVAINHFYTDTDEEIALITEKCAELGVEAAVARVFEKGGEGGTDLASKLCNLTEREPSNFKPLYDLDLSIKEKIEIINREIYGGKDVIFTDNALKEIAAIEDMGYKNLPVCMAKTQYSLSDNRSFSEDRKALHLQ